MSAWKVSYTDAAEKDLDAVFEYISYTLLVPDVAKAQVARIMDAADDLDHMPYRFSLYKDEPWKNKGLRMGPVDNYLVFYLPIETHKQVAIVRILYAGSDIKGRLCATPLID
jgi:toxin ParE1/3/4